MSEQTVSSDFLDALRPGPRRLMLTDERLAELKSLGMYDHTMFIIVADHGEEFWDHGDFEHGHTLYDELVRVPLILKFPTAFHPSQTAVDRQVRVLDVMPTVFDLLDLDQPASFVGESLMPLVRGRPGRDRLAFCESTLYGASLIALRTQQYKYLHDLDGESPTPDELYDWRADPAEADNLIARQPALAAELRTQLLEFHAGLLDSAKTMAVSDTVDMSPRQVEMLKSLGYIR